MQEFKICSKCKIQKLSTKEFFYSYKDRSGKLKLRTYCISCCKIYDKERNKIYYIENKDSLIKKSKEYKQNNREKYRHYNKKYRLNNKEKIKQSSKEYNLLNKDKKRKYRIDNQDRIKKSNKEYKTKNKDIIRYKNNKYLKKRLISNINFKLRTLIKSSITRRLKVENIKKSKSTLKYVGYTTQQLKEHLERLFEPWMNWNNHGKYNSSYWNNEDQSTWRWQIDHIIPVSTFDFTDKKQIKKCWALKNLRPYSAKQNLLDGVNRVRHNVEKK